MSTDLDPLEDFSPEVVAEAGVWVPVTIRDVEWALECVGESEAEIASIEAQVKDAIRRIQTRAEKLTASAKRRADYFRGRVAEFSEANKRDLLIGKKKSRDFISGRVSWRKTGGRLRVEDKKALEEWLTVQPVESGLYRVKVEPDMAALQEQFKAKGEIPPGCEYEPEHDTIHVDAIGVGMSLIKEE